MVKQALGLVVFTQNYSLNVIKLVNYAFRYNNE